MLKDVLKPHAFALASIHSSTPFQVSQEKTPTKIIKRMTIKRKKKSPWTVLTSSPIIQKRKLKPDVGRIIQKTVHSPNFQTRTILIKVMRVPAVNNERNTVV
jgi:hypothetical protein